MKKYFLICSSLLLLSINCYSQNRTNIWELGVRTFNGFPKCGIDFNSGSANAFSIVRDMPFFITNASICDTTGQLLFYTNGIYIANKNHDTLFNGSNYNIGFETNYLYNDGLNISQGAVVIPKPGNNNKYYIVHESGEEFNYDSMLQQQPLYLGLTEIDMSLDAGLGGVTSNRKGIHLIDDTLVNGRITACKHANGRDWWVVVPRFYSATYYKFLITPDSVLGPFSQSIGNPNYYDAGGVGLFSPDGLMYANVSYDNTLNIFHFDRCTGDFYDSTFIQIPNPTPGQPDNEPFSCAFSPNSRFLYIIEYTKILQYDTWAANIASTQTYVAQWDTFSAPTYTYFFLSQLAPDGKIYISTYGGDSLMHYIEFPDSQGTACNVVQNNFFFPSYNGSIPNFPNYELGADTTSILCDSLSIGIIESENKKDIIIFPNPFSSKLTLYFLENKNERTVLKIFDTLGNLILSKNIQQTNQQLDLSFLNSGIYFMNFQTREKNISLKIVKM